MDLYTIIFLALVVFVFLRLRSVIRQRTGSERSFRISAFTCRLSMIAAVLCAVHYVAYEAKWYAAIEARVTPITTISGPARVVDGCAGLVVSALEGPKTGAKCAWSVAAQSVKDEIRSPRHLEIYRPTLMAFVMAFVFILTVPNDRAARTKMSPKSPAMALTLLNE